MFSNGSQNTTKAHIKQLLGGHSALLLPADMAVLLLPIAQSRASPAIYSYRAVLYIVYETTALTPLDTLVMLCSVAVQSLLL